jgi:site-specific DNA recombinase
MKKVIGYCRVSTTLQMEKDNSIKNQIKQIKDYCKRFDLELVDVFVDEGISGLKSDRDGLNQLLEIVNKGDIEGVVVYSLSRLGRKLSNVIDWIELLLKKDIDFYSIKENFNVNEIYGKLMLQILGSLNEFEVNVLGERIKDVKQFKKSKNEVYTGSILYGMYKRGDKLIKNNYEFNTLKKIYTLRDRKGFSYQKIADHLNSLGIPSKVKKQWYASSVRSVYLNGVLQKFPVLSKS